MGNKRTSAEAIAEAQREQDELAAYRARKAAERKAWWDRYYEQLAKSAPMGGGATSRKDRVRVFRLW